MKKAPFAAILALLAALPLSPPAGAQETAPSWMEYKNPYAGEQSDVTNPHRSGEEVVAWASKAVADALSFLPEDFNGQVNEIKGLFAKNGWQGYAAYLRDSKILELARSGKYTISTAANGDPMILRSGEAGGAYHWLVGVPIITSMQEPDENGKLRTAHSSKTIIQISMGRVAEGGGEDGIVIDGWAEDVSGR